MDQEATEGNKVMHRRAAHDTLTQLSLTLGSSLISFATASICIALVALYHKNEAVLIVMTCSTILYGLSCFPLYLLSIKRSTSYFKLTFLKLISVFVQLITLGAAVEYFNRGRKHQIAVVTPIHDNLLVALDSLLLFMLFINGMTIGYTKIRIQSTDCSTDQILKQNCNYSEKFIPLKHSSQTLTPEMDIFQNVQSQGNKRNWNIGQIPTSTSSDEASFPSVVKHRLESLSTKDASPTHSISRKASSISLKLKSVSYSPKMKKSFIGRLKSSKKLKSKAPHNSTEKAGFKNKSKNTNINGCYVTRLSTIPDLSRSVLNFIASSSQDNNSTSTAQGRRDKTTSMMLDTSQFKFQESNNPGESVPVTPALELERDAIERINSALLPPCLRIMEKSQPQQNLSENQVPPHMSPLIPKLEDGFDISAGDSPNVLESNDLGDIPRIPGMDDENASNFSMGYAVHDEFPEALTMEMWETNKNSILKRAETLRENSLLPAFQLDIGKNVPTGTSKSFSFPSKTVSGIREDWAEKGNDYDTISALEEYFKDIGENEEGEGQLLQDGLKQERSSSSITEGRFSKELIRTSTRHSPTKSIISIISAAGSASQQRSQRGSFLGNNNDARPYSQNNHFLPSSSNILINSTAKSSPTRSHRLKRIGKKLSLSNISDTMISHSLNSETSGELFGANKHEHARGKSIDFSYVHTLQSTHSPTKSTSGISANGSIYNDRRHSLATDNALRTASSLFYSQNGNTTIGIDSNLVINSTLNEQLSENRKSSEVTSSSPSQASKESGTAYPEIVMSEYDRERWNTILSLKMVDSQGHLKA